MKMLIYCSFAILSVFFANPLSWADQSDRNFTMTLLPVEETGWGDKDNDSYLWIQQNPKKEISLSFDLQRLPVNLKDKGFKKCTLRIVAKDTKYRADNQPNTGGGSVSLKARLPEDSGSIAIFNELGLDNRKKKDINVALGAGDAGSDLCQKIQDSYKKQNSFKVILESGSDKAGALFYSSRNFNSDPSNLPRLVIEYTQGPPTLLETASWTQHQQNPEHTGRNPWVSFRAPTGFTLAEIPLPKIKIPSPEIKEEAGSIVDYPLIYQGNIYLVSKVEKQNYLLSLDFKGKERWPKVKAIGEGTVQRSPVISRDGIIYVVTENKIAGYDLKLAGADFASYTLTGKPSAFTDLTIGNDGSLFLALTENGLNYAYGFTPDLKPFLKAGPLGKGPDKISTLTASPDGRKIFAQTPAGAIAIDVTNPSERETIKLATKQDMPWEYFHVPIAGPEGGVMIFSDFTSSANKGNIRGYNATNSIWSTAGTLMPQPVLGSNGHVYYIEGGILSGHQYDQVGKADISSAPGLKTTSNLVMDGADNIYFWDNGDLHGYSPEANPLFEKVDFTGTKEGLAKLRPADPEAISTEMKAERNKDSSGPEQFIRLMVGPDGTLWANNQNGNMLFAFTPRYASGDLTLAQKDIKSQTVYRTQNDLRTGGPIEVEEGTRLLFQAGNSIRLDKGFKVKKGASLLIRTDFRQAGL